MLSVPGTTSNVFAKHNHIGLHSSKKGIVGVNFQTVRCLILIKRVFPGKKSATFLFMICWLCVFELLHKRHMFAWCFSASFREMLSLKR